MWPEEEKTQELIANVKHGDSDAVNRLLQRHREAIKRLIDLRMDHKLKQRVDASDIIQDVLVEANRRMEDYVQAEPMPFHLWLRQIAQDRIIDAHRRHRVAARRSLDREQPLVSPGYNEQSTIQLAAQLAGNEKSPAEQMALQELREQFASAVDELDEQDRDIVMMRHFEQLSNSEVAQALNLSAAAASMRYLRAIRRLRTVIGVEDDSQDGESL